MKLYGQVKGKRRSDMQPVYEDAKTRRCPRCGKSRDKLSFMGHDGFEKRVCHVCRKKGYYS